MVPPKSLAQYITLRETLKIYLYFSGSFLILASEAGLMAIVPNMGTLYLAIISIPASKASERNGPTTRAVGFSSRIIFSNPNKASGTGTPAEASRRSMAFILKSLFSDPTITPPLRFISPTAIVAALWDSLPSKNPNEVGTPITIGSAAYT